MSSFVTHTRTKLQEYAAVLVNLIMQQCGRACSVDVQAGYGHRTQVVCRSVFVAWDISMLSQIPCCLCVEQMYTRMQHAYAVESTVCLTTALNSCASIGARELC
jgi:hypothetical protein